MVVSYADPGIFAGGGGGGKASAFLQFYRGVSMVYFKENYMFQVKVPEGVQHFTGEGVQIFPGRGGGGGGGKC